MSDIPIFIICRDKLTPLRALVAWLEGQRHQRLILVDNASTYPPLVDYLASSPHTVVRLNSNMGPFDSIWASGVRDRYAAGERYVVTDCDVIPDERCPGDAIDRFAWCLETYPTYAKAGFGLRIDDLPDCYALADEVRAWERQFWTRPLRKGLFHAPIDTTFALYRPDAQFTRYPAIRTGGIYVARHAPWYSDSANPTEEAVYYRKHCRTDISHWDLDRQGDLMTTRLSLRASLRWRAYALVKVPRDRAAKWE